jgi:TetR/AcrR family transcriptional regulator, transcriptional repressor of aconitase
VPKVTAEHLESRRTQILDGARRVFAQYGYHGATVARLEEATGLSRGAIFHYFDDKDDLFLALGVEANRRYVEAITAGGFAAAIHEIAGESPELIAVVREIDVRLGQDEDFRRRIGASTEEQRDRLEAWFREQRKSGEVREDIDWDDLVRFVGIVVNGLALRIAGGYETNVDAVVRLLDDALRPQRASSPLRR